MTTITITEEHLKEANRLRIGWYRDDNNINPARRSPTVLAVKTVFKQRGIRASSCYLYRQDRSGNRLCQVTLPEPVQQIERWWSDEKSDEIKTLLPLTFELDLEPLR